MLNRLLHGGLNSDRFILMDSLIFFLVIGDFIIMVSYLIERKMYHRLFHVFTGLILTLIGIIITNLIGLNWLWAPSIALVLGASKEISEKYVGTSFTDIFYDIVGIASVSIIYYIR